MSLCVPLYGYGLSVFSYGSNVQTELLGSKSLKLMILISSGHMLRKCNGVLMSGCGHLYIYMGSLPYRKFSICIEISFISVHSNMLVIYTVNKEICSKYSTSIKGMMAEEHYCWLFSSRFSEICSFPNHLHFCKGTGSLQNRYSEKYSNRKIDFKKLNFPDIAVIFSWLTKFS